MEKSALRPLADGMFTAAAGVITTLAGRAATAQPCEESAGESSIRVETDTVATLTTVPANGVAFVTRYGKDEIGRIVQMMLGTENAGGGLDAMQLSIVSETVAQISTAMGESLAHGTAVGADDIHSDVVTDTTAFPVPPFATYTSAIELGGGFAITVTIDFDGMAQARLDIAPERPATIAAPLQSAAARVAAAAAAPASESVRAAEPAPSFERKTRTSSEGQPVSFTPMTPTPIQTAAPGRANLDLVHDIPLEISAVLGQTALSLREVVAMQTGSVFELDKLNTEPIDLYVNNILIARGEVVIVDDKYAVKISELNPVVDKV